MNKFQSLKKELASIFFLEFLLVIIFWDVITLKGILFSGDIRSLVFPFRVYVAECVRNGTPYLWNPYLLAGYPFSADFLSGIFYPFTYFFFLPFTPVKAINYYMVFHYMFSIAAMYCYARVLGISRTGSIASGMIFTLGGFMLARTCHPTIMDIMAFLPVIFILIEVGFRKKRWIYSAYAALIAGMCFLGGHPQIAFYMFSFGALYHLALYFIKTDNSKPEISLLIKSLMVYGCLSVGLSQALMYPLKEMLGYSFRAGGIPWQNLIFGSVPWSHLIRMFFPFFFGQTYDSNYQYQDFNFVETCGYVGLLPLFIILVTLFEKNKNRYQVFFLGLAFLSLLMVLGQNTPIYKIIRYVPVLNFTRAPGRFFLFFTVAAAILTGMGLDRLDFAYFTPARRRYLKISLVVFFLFGTGFFLYALFTKNPFYSLRIPKGFDLLFRSGLIALLSMLLWGWATGYFITFKYLNRVLVLLLAVDLLAFGVILNIDANKAFPLSSFNRTPESVTFLRQDTSHYRIYTFTNKVWDDPEDVDIQFNTLHRNMCMFYHIEGFHSYCSGGVWRFYQILDKLEEPYHPIDLNIRLKVLEDRLSLFRLMNIKYILTPEPLPINGLTEVFHRDTYSIYRVDNVSPRAYFTTNWINVKDDKESLSYLTTGRNNTRNATIIEKGPGTFIANPASKDIPVSIILYSPSLIKMNFTASEKGYLVLADYYYPGWRAYIDGKPVTIYRANFLAKAIPVTEGTHSIQFAYHPDSFYKGITITLLSLIIFLVLFIYDFHFHRNKQKGF